MALKVDVTEEPGLHSILEQNENATSKELQPALDDFLATPGVANSEVEEDLKDKMHRHRETAAAGSGLGKSIRDWWFGEEHEVIATEQRAIELAAYWLTLPAVKDSKVSVSSSTTSSNEVSASFTIAGIGGGPTLKLDLKETVEFETTSPERVSLTSIGTFEKVEAKRLGEPIGTYVRLASIDRDHFDWSVEAAKQPDSNGLGSPTSSRGFELSKSPGTLTESLSIASGTTWELGIDLSLEKLGLSAKLGTKVTYEREVEYKYTLPGGKDYTASRYNSFPAYIWTVGA